MGIFKQADIFLSSNEPVNNFVQESTISSVLQTDFSLVELMLKIRHISISN